MISFYFTLITLLLLYVYLCPYSDASRCHWLVCDLRLRFFLAMSTLVIFITNTLNPLIMGFCPGDVGTNYKDHKGGRIPQFRHPV